MGYSKWSSGDYDNIRKSYSNKSIREIFSSTGMHESMSPFGVGFRESRDSDTHPESLSVQVYLDVTGSMGRIPQLLVTEKLGFLMNTLITQGIEHPQVLFGGIGDQYADRCPLQAGQFESGPEELNHWLTKIFLEGGGGGQMRESYLLAWLFAARHTSTDCFEKRGRKGFIFTIGDEWNWDMLSPREILKITGQKVSYPLTAVQLLGEASRTNHVFHIHVNEGSYRNNDMVLQSWSAMLGRHLIVLENYRILAETIATVVALVEGVSLSQTTRSFDPSTGRAIATALQNFSNTPAL